METDRQRAFEAFLTGVFLTRVRAAALLAAGLVIAGVVFDLVQAPGQIGRLFAIRLAWGLGCVVLWALTYPGPLKAHPSALATSLALALAAGMEVMIAATGGEASTYWPGLAVVMMALGLIFPWSGRHMAAVCGAVVALHVGLSAARGGFDEPAGVLTRLYFLLNVAAVASMGAWFSLRLRRREFDARMDLEWRSEELRQASGNLRQTVEKLQELDRLKSQFFANVSHELRTPLTVLLAILEELEDDPSTPAGVAQRLGVLRSNAQRLLRLINDLLDLAQLDAGKADVRREPVALQALIEAAVADFRPFAERRGIALEAELDGVPVASADPEKLETVLRNLLSNAVKFTPAGGRVTVRGRADGAWAVVEVSDTGVGIRPEDQPRIFDRFSRLSDSDGGGVRGTGIGLALVKELARVHGGEVTVESAPGSGSTFCVRLPGNEVRGSAVPAQTRAREAARGRNTLAEAGLRIWDIGSDLEGADGAAPERPAFPRRVLVAEDHPDLRRFLVAFLGRHYDVVEAADGAAALAQVKAAPVDLIVADVMMPGLSGRELVKALKSDPGTAEIPILLLTAQRGPAAAVEGLQEGADDFIHKPFSPRELLARIRAQLRVRDLNRELLHAQKLALLGTLTAGLAHEVRNPINAIVNGLPLVTRALEQDGERAKVAREMAQIIEEASRRILRIITDLLGFSRQSAEHPGRWSPSRSVETTLQLLKQRIDGTRISVDLRYAGEVRGFPDRLDQVVMNLVDNALKAAGPDGSVEIRTRSEDGGVLLEVEDSGKGIAPEVLARIFDPFFTTRTAGQGTGLGLHVSRQIVEAHLGRLSAVSPAGRGATFRMWIPEARAE